ncbi:MAG: NusG domain II-containing protein [Clostridia bacterium]|nr:NusG domain II-containing protein [Clostridia bacterium]
MIRNDIILALSLVFIAVVAFGFFSLCLKGGSEAVVILDGKQISSHPLNGALEKEIKSEGGTNTLIIEGGKAYIKSASCPDGICKEHRPISAVGETIVCLPNKLVIEIR